MYSFMGGRKFQPQTQLYAKSITKFVNNLCLPYNMKSNSKLYDYQCDILNIFEYGYNPAICIAHARRMGLSYLTQVYLLWRVLFESNSQILVFLPSYYKAGIFSKEVIDMYNYIMSNKKNMLYVPINKSTRENIQFNNGSCLYFRTFTQNSFRGLKYDQIILHDFAHYNINFSIKNFLNLAIGNISLGIKKYPNIIMSSTPDGRGNFAKLYYELQSLLGHNNIDYYKYSWDLNPNNIKKVNQGLMAHLSQEVWDQEYECVWMDK